MRKLFIICLSVFGLSLYAVDYTPILPRTQAPMMEMQSVNNSAFMTSGSAYTPAVYEVGAYSPAKTVIHRAPGEPSGESTYDPANPQFAPIADALMPLMLCALAFALFSFIRMYKNKKNDIT